jgi:hypothetical protein
VANPKLSAGFQEAFLEDLKKLLAKPLLNKPVVLAPSTPGVTAFMDTFKTNIFQSMLSFLPLTMSHF